MKAITLFSGIGGFDIALEGAGVEVDAVCEIDSAAQKILQRHFPNSKLFDDVRKVGVNTHAKRSIDIICGGFPCQDLSIAGKRKGLDGERSGLWFEFARVIDELEPQWVVIENVPGLLSSNRGGDFAVILQWLAQRGYCVAWRVLDAQYFGVAQRRRRVFVVASFGNGRAAEVLFEREGSEWNTAPSREAGQGIADTFTIRSGKEGGGKGYLGQVSSAMTLGGQLQYLAHSVMASGEDITGTLDASYGDKWGLGDQEAVRGTHHVLVSDFAQITSKQHGSKPSEISQPLNTLGQMTVWHNHQQDGSIRIQEDGTTPTVSSHWGTGGNNVPFVGIRRLTPTECERLQGFPDGWTDGQSDSARYKQLGNAVAVPVVEWIINRIVEVNQ